MTSISVAVLAGGASRRMGTDKALLDFDGSPLVARVAQRLRSASGDVFVVAKRRLDGMRCIVEEGDVQTPLLGVLTALRAARHPIVFVCGCDMPFVNVALVRMLAARAREDIDAVVPVHDGKLEGLHGVWSVRAADRIEEMLTEGERGLRPALRRVRVDAVTEDEWRLIDPDGRAFVNMNTPEDLERARSAV